MCAERGGHRARQDEQDVGADGAHGLGEAVAGGAETAADERGKFPTEHEDAHRTIHQPQPAEPVAREVRSRVFRTSMSTLRTLERKALIMSLHPPRCKVGKYVRQLPRDE